MVFHLRPAVNGKADGTSFLTMGDGCGARHLLFFYPEQNWKQLMVDKEGVTEFPFTIYHTGKAIM